MAIRTANPFSWVHDDKLIVLLFQSNFFMNNIFICIVLYLCEKRIVNYLWLYVSEQLFKLFYVAKLINEYYDLRAYDFFKKGKHQFTLIFKCLHSWRQKPISEVAVYGRHRKALKLYCIFKFSMRYNFKYLYVLQCNYCSSLNGRRAILSSAQIFPLRYF